MKQYGQSYDDMPLEELERQFREAFLCTDRLDEPLNGELEKMRQAMDRKRPVEQLYTPEEAWARFLADNAEELTPFLHPAARRPRPASLLLRVGLIAAVIAVLLMGAALAANSMGLWSWAPKWDVASGRFVPVQGEPAAESPILAALAELGVTEPVYPAKLPEGFVLTEYHISEVPRLLMEQYARGSKRFSITVASARSIDSAVFQKSGAALREYRSGAAAYFVFENEGSITAIWYTRNYATFISGNLTMEEITEMVESIETAEEGGDIA